MKGSAVLVLNASYEPLGVVSMERAVTLIVMDSARIIVGTGDFIHSPSVTIEEPSVIILNKMVKPPSHRIVPLSRKALFSRDGHKCAFCGGDANTIDHVTPRSKGGKNTWDNVVAACRPCNAEKADRTPEQAGMPLLWQPYNPTRVGMIAARRREDWKEFLV